METLSELILLLGQFLSDSLNYLMHSISVYIQTSLESISPSSSEISSNAPWSVESYVGRLTGLFFVIIFFGLPIWIVLIVNFFKNRRAKLVHETLQIALQNGQELSVDVIKSLPGYEGEKKKDSYQAFTTAGTGLGLMFFGLLLFQSFYNPLSGIGALIFFIGLAELVGKHIIKKDRPANV